MDIEVKNAELGNRLGLGSAADLHRAGADRGFLLGKDGP